MGVPVSDVEGRREFLKKAGTVVWVVPTLQVINMSSALAGGGGGTTGSVVVTTVPPSTTQPPECSCSLTEVGRRYHDDGLFEADYEVHVSSECVEHAKYSRVYINGDLIGEGAYEPAFTLVGPTDELPVVMTVKVLDENMETLTSCQITVDAPEEQRRAAAGAAGARRGFRVRMGR